MDLLASVLAIFSRGIVGIGSLMIVWYGIQTASAFQQHNGSGIKEGLWGVGSGVIVTLMGALLTSVTF